GPVRRYNAGVLALRTEGLAAMSALLSPLRRRPAAAAVTLGLLLLAGYGAYRVGRHAWADGHYRAAQRELQARDFAAARADLAVCLAAWPDDAATHLLAARAARRAGDLAEAERELAAADGLGEPSADRTLERALLAAQQGDMRTAEPVLLA